MAVDHQDNDQTILADLTKPDACSAIVLAGGMSSRMGDTNKLLLTYDGFSLLRRATEALVDAGIGELVVVLGHESDKMREQLHGLDVKICVNAQYEQGQMTSVQCGLSALSGTKEAVIISLSDQPLMRSEHIRYLVDEYGKQPFDKQILVPMYQSTRGNPVIISESVRRQVLESGKHPGCRRFIDANPELVNWLQVDDMAFVTDVDTPGDYAALNEINSLNEKSEAVGKPKA